MIHNENTTSPLRQFRNSMAVLLPKDAEQRLCMEDGDFEGCSSVLVYNGDCYIMDLGDGTFCAPIEQDEYRGTLEEIERRMFFDWYVTECRSDYDTAYLTALLDEWCEWVNYPKDVSADELLQRVVKTPFTERSDEDNLRACWLQRFIAAWEKAEAASAPAAQELTAVGIKMTWQSSLPMLLAILENGTPEGRAMAEKELRRMAKVADLAVEQAQ